MATNPIKMISLMKRNLVIDTFGIVENLASVVIKKCIEIELMEKLKNNEYLFFNNNEMNRD